MPQIDDMLKEAIWQQIAHEKTNQQIYQYIAAFLKNKGLDKLAANFESGADEELGHSKEFISLLTDLDTPVVMLEIPTIQDNYNTILDIAKRFLDREILTTQSIGSLRDLAIEQKNYVCEEMFREMIAKQQGELDEANSFMDSCLLLPEWWQVAIWDKSL